MMRAAVDVTRKQTTERLVALLAKVAKALLVKNQQPIEKLTQIAPRKWGVEKEASKTRPLSTAGGRAAVRSHSCSRPSRWKQRAAKWPEHERMTEQSTPSSANRAYRGGS